jgi:endogenous inhibitor of DNA gyrase (YacG/DUF329 family)
MKHKCSICGSEFKFEYHQGEKLPPNFPFCSERCKLIALSKWLNEDYRISVPLPNTNLITEDDKQKTAKFWLETGEVEEIIEDDVGQDNGK